MQQPLQIAFHEMDHSDAIEARIRTEAEELERLCDRITTCRVTVEAPHPRRRKGNLYAVRIVINVPDRLIAVGREHQRDHAHEDVYVAIRDAFDAAARQLDDYAQKMRGQIKRHEPQPHGTVIGLFPAEGYGFARMPDGTDVYFHQNSVVGAPLSALDIGDEVRVVVAEGEGEKGPQASTVVPVGKHHLTGGPTA